MEKGDNGNRGYKTVDGYIRNDENAEYGFREKNNNYQNKNYNEKKNNYEKKNFVENNLKSKNNNNYNEKINYNEKKNLNDNNFVENNLKSKNNNNYNENNLNVNKTNNLNIKKKNLNVKTNNFNENNNLYENNHFNQKKNLNDNNNFHVNNMNQKNTKKYYSERNNIKQVRTSGGENSRKMEIKKINSFRNEYYTNKKNEISSFENLSKNLLSTVSYINYPDKNKKNFNTQKNDKNTIKTQQKLRSSNFVDCYTPNFIRDHIEHKIITQNQNHGQKIYNEQNIIERESLQQNYNKSNKIRSSHNSYNSIYSQTLNKNIHLYKTPQKMFSTNNSNRSEYFQNKGRKVSVESGSKGSTLWINSPFDNNNRKKGDGSKGYNIYRNQKQEHHQYKGSNDYGYGR